MADGHRPEQDPTKLHSTLELVKNDATANAPERDRFAEAPELDRVEDAPKVAPSYLPEKEVVAGRNNEGAGLSTKGLSRKAWIIIIALAVTVLAIGIGVGVGVGIGVSRRNSTVSAASASSSSSVLLPSSTSAALPASTSNALEHGVLEDSSFAAVSGADGSKYVFFQDISGALRQAYYSQSAQSWATDDSFIVPNTLDARNHTPLAATIEVSDLAVGEQSADEIFLFYISSNNVLSARWYVSGAWATPQETGMVNLGSFVASLDSRSLSVTAIPQTNNSELLLYYQDSSRNVSAFHGKKNINSARDPNGGVIDDVPGGVANPLWTWQNLTNELYASSPNSTFGPPFFSSFYNQSFFSNRSTTLLPQAVFFDPVYPRPFGSVYFNENGTFLTSNETFGATPFDSNTNRSVVENSDFIPGVDYSVYGVLSDEEANGPNGYWVNGTEMAFLNPFTVDAKAPSRSTFPYTRLAITAGSSNGAYSMFHQIDALTIAEDVWDDGRSSWTSFNISISGT